MKVLNKIVLILTLLLSSTNADSINCNERVNTVAASYSRFSTFDYRQNKSEEYQLIDFGEYQLPIPKIYWSYFREAFEKPDNEIEIDFSVDNVFRLAARKYTPNKLTHYPNVKLKLNGDSVYLFSNVSVEKLLSKTLLLEPSNINCDGDALKIEQDLYLLNYLRPGLRVHDSDLIEIDVPSTLSNGYVHIIDRENKITMLFWMFVQNGSSAEETVYEVIYSWKKIIADKSILKYIRLK